MTHNPQVRSGLAILRQQGFPSLADAIEAELNRLRAENQELRKQRAILLESQTHWMSVAGGRC